MAYPYGKASRANKRRNPGRDNLEFSTAVSSFVKLKSLGLDDAENQELPKLIVTQCSSLFFLKKKGKKEVLF